MGIAGLAATVILFIHLGWAVTNLPAFGDEAIMVRAAANFLTHGDYSTALTPAPFDPGVSSGLLATWPGGLGWLLTHRLLGARIAAALVTWLEGMVLVMLWTRRLGSDAARGFGIASILWLFFLRLPLSLSFVWSLGEIPAAIWIGIGLCLLARSPVSAFVCFGVSVWLGKVIYLPIVVCVGGAWLWTMAASRKTPSRRLLLAPAGFILPLIGWLLVIALRYDLTTALAWPHALLALVRSGHSGVDVLTGAAGIGERLAAHWQLWSGYPVRTRYWVLTCLGSPGLISGALWAGTGVFRPWTRLEKSCWIATLIALACYAGWFFLFDPFLWLRHILPAVCLGFGALVYLLVRVGQAHVTPRIRNRKKFFLVVMTFWLGWQILTVRPHLAGLLDVRAGYGWSKTPLPPLGP